MIPRLFYWSACSVGYDVYAEFTTAPDPNDIKRAPGHRWTEEEFGALLANFERKRRADPLGSSSEVVFREDACPTCGQRKHVPVVRPMYAEAKYPSKKWPDVLKCFGEVSALSDRCVANLKNAGIASVEFHPLTLVDLPPKRPCPWQYWLLKPSHTVVFDPDFEDERLRRILCPACGRWNSSAMFKRGIRMEGLKLREESPTVPAFAWAEVGDRLESVCSEAIIELARTSGWTNIEFRVPGRVYGGNCLRVRHQDAMWRVQLEEKLREIEEEEAAQRRGVLSTASEKVVGTTPGNAQGARTQPPKLFRWAAARGEYAVLVGNGLHPQSRTYVPGCSECHTGRTTCEYKELSLGGPMRMDSRWPDFLDCMVDGALVSECVADDLRASGIEGFRLVPIELRYSKDVPPETRAPWRYWGLQAAATVAFDPVLTEWDVERMVCKRCGRWTTRLAPPVGPQNRRIVLRDEEWNGADFAWADVDEGTVPVCSERIVDMAREQGWTNCAFTAMLGIHAILVEHAFADWRDRLSARLAEFDFWNPSPVTASVYRQPPFLTEQESPPPSVTDPGAETPPEHPFDDLCDDGFASQGLCQLRAGFGTCGLLVFSDGEEETSGEQRALFDQFVASEERWLPVLQRKMAAILREAIAVANLTKLDPLPVNIPEYQELSRWLNVPDVSISAQDGTADGIVEISYAIRGTDFTVCALVRPDAKASDELVRVSHSAQRPECP